MKPLLIILLSIITTTVVYPQRSTIDAFSREKLISTKSKIFQQIRQAELQATENQEAYNITYYALELKPNPQTEILSGSVEIVGNITDVSIDHIELNFWSGMEITDIHILMYPDVQLYYTHNDDLLSIGLDREYLQGEEFRIFIGYYGQPQKSLYGSFDFGMHNDQPMIWTLSQPFGARAWWPCKDVPSDKADSLDIKVTVPQGLIVASNGSLREKINQGNETMYWWHEQYPIVTYLVFIGIYPYTVYYDDYLYNNDTDTMKIHFYMFPENYEELFSLNEKTKNMIGLFAQLFGEYPFIEEKYGHADFLSTGAMEHQTCSSFGFWNEWVFAHELVHQWWGDFVTCENFHHIWLNEGFATYGEALWYEHLNGSGSASYYQITANLYLGPGTVYVEDPQNEAIFDGGLSYSKGSWVLHMLRHVVGDSTFYDILRAYYKSEQFQFGTATTEKFQYLCEQISGINLEKFFHQWVYEEYYPQYIVNWSWIQNGPNYDIELEIRQQQSNHLFWMPIDVTVKTKEGEYTSIVWDSLESQNFQISVSSEPILLEIDKYNWILKTVQEEIKNPTFDKGILLVNGVNFDVYEASISDAYESKAFWGDFPISFWDCFNPPEAGYPSTLPAPLGHGKIPTNILGSFSTVIWIGNNFEGDISAWYQTSILPYIKAGGNLFLMTRHGQDFINEEMRDYLGISWAENTTNTIANCISDFQGLLSMEFVDTQSLNAVFDMKFSDNESTVLFKETLSFNEEIALGVWKKPSIGGSYRPGGGQFVFISGRPYRYKISEMRINSEYILENFFMESKTVGIDEMVDLTIPGYFKLYQNCPNPFNLTTIINYELPKAITVEINIYNLLGQKILTLVSEMKKAGIHQVDCDASDLPSGIYYYRITAGNFQDVKKMILLK